MKKNKGGRPTVMTLEVIGKLEAAFASGATDLEACFFAGISKDALYDYQLKHPEFTERKEALKSQLNLIAKNVVADSIKNGKNVNDAKWYLEKRDDDFKPKSKVDVQPLGEDGKPTSGIKLNVLGLMSEEQLEQAKLLMEQESRDGA